MAALTPAQRSLSRWILAQEMDGPESDVARLTERGWQKLSDCLANIFTVPGCEALGKRAVYLALIDFPSLKAPSCDTALESLNAALDGGDEEDVAQVAEAVYAHLINLLVTLIGEALALRAIRDVWPGASLNGTDTTGQEANT